MKIYPTVVFLLLFGASSKLFAQFEYEVTTLIPENSNIIDDGLAIDEQGTLYGSYWGIWQGAAGRHVLRYRTEGSYDTLATGFNRPNGLNYRNGKLYLANGGASQLVVIDTNGTQQVLASVPGISNAEPVPGTDSLIATSWGQNKVYGISTDGTINTISSSPLYSGPVGTTFDPDGNLYVANFNNGKILKLENGNVEVLADIGGGIGFITYSDGAILATNHTDKRVYRIPLNGIGTEIIAGSGQAVIADGVGTEASFKSPNGIVATPSGDTIYVSEFSGKALRMIVRSDVAVTKNNTQQASPAYRLYPTPANNQMSFEPALPPEAAIGMVRDTNGRVVQTLTAQALQANQIDCSALPSGMYFLSVYSKGTKLLTEVKMIVSK